MVDAVYPLTSCPLGKSVLYLLPFLRILHFMPIILRRYLGFVRHTQTAALFVNRVRSTIEPELKMQMAVVGEQSKLMTNPSLRLPDRVSPSRVDLQVVSLQDRQ